MNIWMVDVAENLFHLLNEQSTVDESFFDSPIVTLEEFPFQSRFISSHHLDQRT